MYYRQLTIKNIGDCVEVLIGAYLRTTGEDGEPHACHRRGYILLSLYKVNELYLSSKLAKLEEKLKYTFNNKALLIEAVVSIE